MLRDRSKASSREIPVVVKKSRRSLPQAQAGVRAPGTVTSSLMERYPPALAKGPPPGQAESPQAATARGLPPGPVLPGGRAPGPAPAPVAAAPPVAATLAPVVFHRPPPVEIPVERFLDDLDEILDEGREHQSQGSTPKAAAVPAPEPSPRRGRGRPSKHSSVEPNPFAIIDSIEEAVGELDEFRVLRARMRELERLRREVAALHQEETARQVKLRQRAVRGAADIPDVNPAAVDAITRMLMEDHPKTNKPPIKAAHLLAIICKLYEEHRPFPEREAAGAAIGSPKATVESVLSHRAAEGYITMKVETREGNVDPNRRPSIVRERYYVPSKELLEVYNNPYYEARRKQERAS
jgi:hypothetical protein